LTCPPASGGVGIRDLGALKLLFLKPPCLVWIPFKLGSQTLKFESRVFFSQSTPRRSDVEEQDPREDGEAVARRGPLVAAPPAGELLGMSAGAGDVGSGGEWCGE